MEIALLGVLILVLSFALAAAPRALGDRLSPDRLADITGVAAGLLLASALLVVVPEGFHVAAQSGEVGEFLYEPAVLGATVLAGFALMLILEGLGAGHDVHEEHHDHLDGHGHSHVHHPSSMPVLALGLSVHALADGVAIGAAAAAGDTAFSILVAASVIIHRIPAAFSLGLFSLHQPEGDRRWLPAIAAFSIATPLAMLVSFAILDGADDRAIALTLLFSAGTFVYVATVDTLPAMHNPETGRRSLRNVLLGAALFAAIVFVTASTEALEHDHGPADEHENGEDDHDEP